MLKKYPKSFYKMSDNNISLHYTMNVQNFICPRSRTTRFWTDCAVWRLPWQWLSICWKRLPDDTQSGHGKHCKSRTLLVSESLLLSGNGGRINSENCVKGRAIPTERPGKPGQCHDQYKQKRIHAAGHLRGQFIHRQRFAVRFLHVVKTSVCQLHDFTLKYEHGTRKAD